MIRTIFQRIFGAPSARPAADNGEQENVDQPKDELVQDKLPVEPGFFYTREHNRRTNPKTPTLVAQSLEHLWSGKALADDLNKQLRQVRSKMLSEEIRDGEIERLVEQDQSAGDFDTRPGHVVIPDRSFEYHGSLETVRYPETAGRVERDGETFSLTTEAGYLKVERDSEQHRYLPNQTPVIETTNFEQHTTTINKGEFAVSKDGVVSLPSASSLEEAEQIEQQRHLAVQTQTAINWMEAARKSVDYRVDQFEFDHDPRVGHTVASGIDDYWFLKETGLPSTKHQTYSVEQSSTSLRVYEDSYSKNPELVAKINEREGRMHMQLFVDGGDHSLHAVWDKQNDTISSEIRQHKDYQPPAPRMEPAATYGFVNSGAPREDRGRTETLPHGFSSSGRIRSHGGGHHVMVKGPAGHSRESHFPQRFTDEKSGKTYLRTTYTQLDGSRLYTESR